MKNVFLDANNLFYKVWFLYRNRGLKTIYDMFFSILKITLQQDNISVYDQVNNIKIIWDSGFGSWRSKIYKEYKKTRDPIAIFGSEEEKEKFYDMRTKVKWHIENKTAFKQIQINLFEADDVISRLVENRKNMDYEIIIISCDRDYYQLLRRSNPTVWIKRIGHPVKKNYNFFDFVGEYKIHPRYWVDMKSLAGDSGDNIKGIKGIIL